MSRYVLQCSICIEYQNRLQDADLPIPGHRSFSVSYPGIPGVIVMYAGFVVFRLAFKSGAIWRCFRCLGVKRDARTPCRRGTDFRSLSLRESGPGTPRAVSVSGGLRAWFRLRSGCGFCYASALVAVTAAETEFPLRSTWFPLHPSP